MFNEISNLGSRWTGRQSSAAAGLVIALLAPQAALANDKVFGTWRMVSFYTEDVETKVRNNLYGERPNGVIGFTPQGRFFAVVTTKDRMAPKAVEEQAAAFRTTIAYSGKYRLEEDRFITNVDVAWNEAWVGTEQVRYWRLDGDARLHVQSAPIPNPNDPNKKAIAILIFERE
jgi:hypothetical protein